MAEVAFGLSNEQAAALGRGISLIEAGPGSGKTRTVVARFRQNSSVSRGVALLSFTNAAVKVARTRCASTPHFLDDPNFVGTFDKFLHQFVVTPAELRVRGVSPRYFASWDDLPDHLARVRPPSGGIGIRLSRWAVLEDGTVHLDESRLPYDEGQFWRQLSPYTQTELRRRGAERLNGLLSRQILDMPSARRLALEHLREGALLQRIARRFSEIIVDEFQDCDEVEHSLLSELSGAGVHIVAVADPDQAIYEFRQVNPAAYNRYREATPQEEIATLTVSYRSTVAICALASALRSECSIPVTSYEPEADRCAPIQIVVGAGIKAGAAAARLISQHGIPFEGTRIVGHRRSDARAIARRGVSAPGGSTMMERIFSAVADLLGSVDARVRHVAMTRLETSFLALVDWPGGQPPESRSTQLEVLGMTGDQLRIIARRVVASSPGWVDARAAAGQVREVFQTAADSLGIQLVSTLGGKLAKPRDEIWRYWTSRTTDALINDVAHIKWTHVHAIKGDEFDAIVYVLPSRAVKKAYVLDDWLNHTSTEARRVLYVGITRARKLVVIVVPQGRVAQLESLLQRDGVQYDITIA